MRGRESRWEDFKLALEQALLFVSQLSLFCLLRVIAGFVPAISESMFWGILSNLLFALVGGLLPILLWGRLATRVIWEVDGISASGQSTINLRERSRKEFTIRMEMVAEPRSILAKRLLKRCASRERKFQIKLYPTDSIRMKEQVPSGKAEVMDDYVVLPFADDGNAGSQSSMHMTAKVLAKGSDMNIRVTVSHPKRLPLLERPFILCQSDIKDLRIVS